MLAVGFFATINATLAAVNHSRVDLDLGKWLYQSRAHNEHHRRGHLGGNYAQFCQLWDVLGGTRVTGEEQKKEATVCRDEEGRKREEELKEERSKKD